MGREREREEGRGGSEREREKRGGGTEREREGRGGGRNRERATPAAASLDTDEGRDHPYSYLIVRKHRDNNPLSVLFCVLYVN